MVRYRRNFVPGGTYFFTVTLADRRSNFLVDHIVALRSAFQATRRKRPFKIDAIVVLPEHLHAVLTLPHGDANFSARWRDIKTYLTNRIVAAGNPILRHASGERTLWQRRFWEHTIRDETDFVRHVDYIHFNPVKHHLVTRACDWPYSSFHRYVGDGLLVQDWAGKIEDQGSSFGEPKS
jgi:putative transposase